MTVCPQIGKYRKVYKFLETQELNHEEIENLNWLLTDKDVKSVIKSPRQRKTLDQMASLVH